MRRVTANHDEADATRRHPARRGAALVLVLIFTAGALMLVSTLLAVTTNQAQATAEHHRQQSLHAVLRAGIAAAVNEINRDQTAGPYDPGNDGVGALLGPAGPDGLREG